MTDQPEFEHIERPSCPALDSILGEPFEVLDHGFVRVVDYMGDEAAIVQGARVSYGKGTKSVREDIGLIRYLMRKRHTSPFELAVLKLHVKLPIVVERQWVRHRTCSMNEMSGRYSVMPTEYYVPDTERLRVQDKTNRQGSGEDVLENAESLQSGFDKEASRRFDAYQYRLEQGLAREVSRNNLPLSTYTEKYWQMDLHNLLHFLQLRMDPHAQWEIRQYANVIGDIVASWMPNVWQAFQDFRQYSESLSLIEFEVLQAMMAGDDADAVETAESAGWLDMHPDGRLKRRGERVEFERKLERMGLTAPWHLEGGAQ